MVKIRITESALVFEVLTDDIMCVVDGLNLEVKEVNGKFRVTAAPKKLYYLLHELAKDFDIEIW